MICRESTHVCRQLRNSRSELAVHQAVLESEVRRRHIKTERNLFENTALPVLFSIGIATIGFGLDVINLESSMYTVIQLHACGWWSECRIFAARTASLLLSYVRTRFGLVISLGCFGWADLNGATLKGLFLAVSTKHFEWHRLGHRSRFDEI